MVHTVTKALYFKSFLLCLFVSNSFQSQADLTALTCEPEWQSLLKELAGDKVSAYSATTGLQDPHKIQARPSLIAKARQADLLVCTGAELEIGWLPLLLRKSANKDIQPYARGYFMATDYALLLEKPELLDRSMGDIHASGNPHVHLDPHRLADIAVALSDKLQTLDPDNAAFYQQRLADFSSRWQKAIKHWEAKARSLAGMKVITYHRSWIYFQDWLKLDLVATVEPKPGIPPSSGYLAELIRTSKQQQARVIFHAAYVNAKSANWLGNKTGIPVVNMPYTVGGDEQVKDLFSLFDVSIARLLEATNK